MSNELNEIKQLILQSIEENHNRFETIENNMVSKNDFIAFKKGIYEQFEMQNDYIDEGIKEVGVQNRNHLEALLENKNDDIKAVAEQYTDLRTKFQNHEERITALEI